MRHDSEPPLEPEPSLPGRVVYFGCVAAAATALFVLVSGVHAEGGQPDARRTVAQCWHKIEEAPTGENRHQMRVACQQLESSLRPAQKLEREAVVASQD